MSIEDLTINELIEALKIKVESKNLKKIKELQNKIEKQNKDYLKMVNYFKDKIKKLEEKNK